MFERIFPDSGVSSTSQEMSTFLLFSVMFATIMFYYM
jgi:hypothetical protein